MPDRVDHARTPAPRVVVTSLAADRQALAGEQPCGQQPSGRPAAVQAAAVQPAAVQPAALHQPAAPGPAGQQIAGQPASASEGAHLPLVPSGMCHGAVLGGAVTLCGLDTAGLSWFPGLPFAAADFLARCRACLDLLSPAAS